MTFETEFLSQVRGRFDAASRQHFALFLRRVLATTAPGARYQHNWHIEAIAEYLAACAAGDITRLVINLPPRMLKSTVVSVAWPAWLLGHNPRQRLMVASYAQSLAIKHSTDCRAVIQSPWYQQLFPDTRLARDQNEKEKFATTERGYRLAVSVGGAAIGEGGNILMVDDPINPLQAGSRTMRDAVNQWFDHTFVTRLDDKQRGAIVVVMQRLHAEDLSGYLLAKGGWEHLCLPAIASCQQWIQVRGFSHARPQDDVLHPAREPLAVLERTQRELGSAQFNAQYQQAPVRQVGALVKPEWFGRFQSPSPQPSSASGSGGSMVQSWDTAIKIGAANDASTCATFTVDNHVHKLVDMQVVKLEYPALKRFMIAHAVRFSPDAILIEDKASGQSLLQDLRREPDLPVIGILPTADKLTRLARVTPLMEAGKVALPEFAPWLAAFEAEFFAFPDSPHDDQVDAVSQYLNWIRDRVGKGEMQVRRV